MLRPPRKSAPAEELRPCALTKSSPEICLYENRWSRSQPGRLQCHPTICVLRIIPGCVEACPHSIPAFRDRASPVRINIHQYLRAQKSKNKKFEAIKSKNRLAAMVAKATFKTTVGVTSKEKSHLRKLGAPRHGRKSSKEKKEPCLVPHKIFDHQSISTMAC